MTALHEPRLRARGRAFAHIAEFHPELTALRRDLHAHPELGFEERYTAARVAEALKSRYADLAEKGLLHILQLVRDCTADAAVEVLSCTVNAGSQTGTH